MSCSARCLDAVRMKSCGIGPKRSRETIPSPGNWTMRSIDVVWLVSFMTFHFFFLGVGPFSLYLFSIFHRGIQGVRVSTNRAVAYPPMSLPSTCQTQLGRAVLGSKLFVLIFFLFVRFSGVHRESACVSHLSMARSSHPWWGMQPLRKNDGWLKTG